MSKFRIIPSIEQLRQRDEVRRLETKYGHTMLVTALRNETEQLRERLARGETEVDDSETAARQIERAVQEALTAQLTPSLRSVINATGVIIHTNLGRAPLASVAIDQIGTVASGYCNLEYDLAAGGRGQRAAHAAALLTRLTGAEAAAVVNNNAAALLLVLTVLARGREVIISRGELVEIGGGFRIPEVLRQSGATLREVGTTNRTRAEDYAAAISDKSALILRVHPSNFRVEGFAERPGLSEVVDVGGRYGVPVVEDLGSGNLSPEVGQPARSWAEPTIQDSLRQGVALCCVSGDKLLGGPQCGIILGDRTEVTSLSGHPLMRALRVDKLIYAALEATLLEHVSGRAADTVPVARMMNTPVDVLASRAQQITGRLSSASALTVTTTPGQSPIGGGAAPGTTVESVLLEVAVDGLSADALETRLRSGTPPVIGRIDRDRVLLDLRTVAPQEDETLVSVLMQVAES